MSVPRLVLLCVLATFARVGAQPPHLVYSATVKDGDRKSFHFSLEITNPPQRELFFEVPLWAPGAYRRLTVEPRGGPPAEEQLCGFAAHDGAGRPLDLSAGGPRRWKVDAHGVQKLTLNWRNADPGRRPNNRSYLTETCGLIDGPRSWLSLEGGKDLPAHVHFHLPEGWEVGTGLEPTFDPMVFTARDYDRLADCPTLVGRFESWTFEVWGVPHRMCLDAGDRPVRFDPDQAVDVVRRIVAANVGVFGDVPYEHYTFIFTPGGGGGLEHLTSTTIGVGSRRSITRAQASVVAHEHFHAWNVKRLRPFALGPFDYQHDPQVSDLWFCEGVTSYYTPVALWRSGLSDEEGFRNRCGGAISTYERNASYRRVSPQEASRMMFEKWAEMPVSFYTQGMLIGLVMDLSIRGRTGNRFGLDDVMRSLYHRHGGYYRHHPALPGFRSEDIPATVKEVTGVDLDGLFERHVAAAEPIDWDAYLAYAGWRLAAEEKEESLFRHARIRHRGEDVVLSCEEGDACFQAGFRPGDRLVAVNGVAVETASQARSMLRDLEPGKTFDVRVERGGREAVVKGEVRLLKRRVVTGIENLPEPGPDQLAVRMGILHGCGAPREGGPAGKDGD